VKFSWPPLNFGRYFPSNGQTTRRLERLGYQSCVLRTLVCVRVPIAVDLWKARAPLVHKLHLWFSKQGRLWTADRLQRRSLQHPSAFALCCKEPETVNHIMVQCSFSCEISYTLLLNYRLHSLTPQASADFTSWWSLLGESAPPSLQKELNALVILVARRLWRERNSRVFDKFATLPREVCRMISDESEQWKKAGLHGL
jgi:hypothetical protein